MVLTIARILAFDEIHPPTIATTLSFALQNCSPRTLLLFGVALGLTIGLIELQRFATRQLR